MDDSEFKYIELVKKRNIRICYSQDWKGWSSSNYSHLYRFRISGIKISIDS